MKTVIYASLLTAVVSAYLFVTAPPPLPDKSRVESRGDRDIPVSDLFNIVNQINKDTRNIWTARIVSKGTEAGLKFEEHWLDEGHESGPLPALFMRLTAENLEKQRAPLAVFLGSDMPIKKANIFQGEQVDQFIKMREDFKPKYFSMQKMGIEVGMYPDIASAPGCVSCHNDHPDSAKHDWKLIDLMGAATWTYPTAAISQAELHESIGYVYKAIARSYQTYIEKAQSFSTQVQIGAEWPEKGKMALPDTAVFMSAVIQATAQPTINATYLGRDSKK